ncbi:MAG: hypothetical protein JEZ11_01345 [Desulfobacterales bacterium]|nr:hypothetical protein [Desulfobacterales bacterium]
MRQRPIIQRCLWLVLALVLAGHPVFAQNEAVEQVGEAGSIDWVGQKLVATGTGVAPAKAFNRAQGLAMAQRAAVVVARRNLLEVVKGVHIDSNTRVESFILKSDVIETRVRGVLRNSQVDDVQVISDTEVEATVSMTMTGDLGKMLMEMAVQAEVPAAAPSGLDGRINALEERVQALEQRLSKIGSINLEQEAAIGLFRQLVAAWSDYAALHPRLTRAAYASDADLSALSSRMARQAAELEALNGKLDAMARRLASLESGAAVVPAPAAKPSTPLANIAPYTGLVIDARNLGFRPCLKPEVYAGGKLYYPGGAVEAATAVRRGFVRFYRQVTRAQKSDRAGSLPLTIRATGVYQGDRSLTIADADARILAAIAEAPNGFLARCKVVIVF